MPQSFYQNEKMKMNQTSYWQRNFWGKTTPQFYAQLKKFKPAPFIIWNVSKNINYLIAYFDCRNSNTPDIKCVVFTMVFAKTWKWELILQKTIMKKKKCFCFHGKRSQFEFSFSVTVSRSLCINSKPNCENKTLQKHKIKYKTRSTGSLYAQFG